jgi:hypothetical protein
MLLSATYTGHLATVLVGVPAGGLFETTDDD